MRDCEELGEAIERHLRGAAPAEEDARVQAHLAACFDCRDFVERARRIEAELAAPVEVSPAPAAQWALIQQRLRAERRAQVTLGVFGLVSLALAPFEALGFIDEPSPDNGLVALAMVAMAAFMVVLGFALRASSAAAKSSPEGLLRWARDSAVKERRGAWLGAALFVGFAVFCFDGSVAGDLPELGRGIVGGVGLLHLGFAALALRRAREARRELQVLA